VAVRPVVVSVRTEQTLRGQEMGHNPWEEFFFGPAPQRQPRPEFKQEGLGSGVIVSAQGYILTNNHVVEGANKIVVTLFDKREFEAKIVGTDKESDLAVIRIEPGKEVLPVAFLGDSDKLRIGDWVMAVGNPFGLNHTVTQGIVSAKEISGRGITQYENFIQTDAAINPGNSGGALVDMQGALVGINTAILSRTGGFQGIGFAIPINMARDIMRMLIDHGKVVRGFLGVSLQDLDPALSKALKLEGTQGALVAEVIADSPAEQAGVQAGDVVLELNGVGVVDVNTLRNRVALLPPGKSATLLIIRDGKRKNIEVKVSSRSGEEMVGLGGEAHEEQLGLALQEVDAAARARGRVGSI